MSNGGKVSLSGMARRESWDEWRERLARMNPHAGPAVVASMGHEVSVGRIGYVARRCGRDAEDCIKEAVDAGSIELVYVCDDRDFDAYRLTAKGRRLHRRHMQYVRMIGDRRQ